ncbi:basic proline-rich protein [Pongo pygmaeus]|uniref:basic proline-rich protein n=1 Tax=Pongo pygmaeus TaxID=9600 RepID=UPI00300DB845
MWIIPNTDQRHQKELKGKLNPCSITACPGWRRRTFSPSAFPPARRWPALEDPGQRAFPAPPEVAATPGPAPGRGGSAVALRDLPSPQAPRPAARLGPWPLAAHCYRPGPGRPGACCGRGAARPELPVERLPEGRAGTAQAPPASAAADPDPCPDPRGRPRPLPRPTRPPPTPAPTHAAAPVPCWLPGGLPHHLPGPQRPPPSPAPTSTASPVPCPDPRGLPRPLPRPPRRPLTPAPTDAAAPILCPVSCGRPCLLPCPCPVSGPSQGAEWATADPRSRPPASGLGSFLASGAVRGRFSRVLVWGKRKQTAWTAVKMSAAKEQAATRRLVGPGLIKTGVE